MESDNLVPFEVIVAAKLGDSGAMYQIVQHYEHYMSRYARRTLLDEYGSPHQVTDREIKDRIQAKVMYQLIYDFDPYRLPDGETLER